MARLFCIQLNLQLQQRAHRSPRVEFCCTFQTASTPWQNWSCLLEGPSCSAMPPAGLLVVSFKTLEQPCLLVISRVGFLGK